MTKHKLMTLGGLRLWQGGEGLLVVSSSQEAGARERLKELG
jgi:hypothetical protein